MIQQSRAGNWQYDHHYLGHLAWLPPGAKHSESRHINLRGSPHLAGSNLSAVWCGPMELRQLDQPMWLVTSPAGSGQLTLQLEPTRPAIRHGENGFSSKDDAGAASHYYSFSRLAVQGSWQLDGAEIPLRGYAWFDHEWFSGGLGRQLGGWDWWCWRLDNGDDLMLGWLRDPQGKQLPKCQRWNAETILAALGAVAMARSKPFQPWTSNKKIFAGGRN